MSISLNGSYSGNQHVTFGKVINAAVGPLSQDLNITNPLNLSHPAGCYNFDVEQIGYKSVQTCIDHSNQKWGIIQDGKWHKLSDNLVQHVNVPDIKVHHVDIPDIKVQPVHIPDIKVDNDIPVVHGADGVHHHVMSNDDYLYK